MREARNSDPSVGDERGGPQGVIGAARRVVLQGRRRVLGSEAERPTGDLQTDRPRHKMVSETPRGPLVWGQCPEVRKKIVRETR